MGKTAWATQDPYITLAVGLDIGAKPHLPLRRELRPGGIYLELWQTAFSYMRSLRRRSLSEDGPGQTRDQPDHDDPDQTETEQSGTLHEFSPIKKTAEA